MVKQTSLSGMACPVARAIDRVGAWWSILILRDAFHGLTRFEQFQKSLPIATNMLTRRLATLVDQGLLERRRYSDHPPRDEYLLTSAGRDFYPVLISLFEWGNRNFTDPIGPAAVLVDHAGAIAEPVLVDAKSGRRIDETNYRFASGPGADDDVKRRMGFIDRQRQKSVE